MSQTWLSIVEYARTFNISDMTVRRRIKTGKLESVLKEGKYFIPVGMNESGEYIKPSKGIVASPKVEAVKEPFINPLTGAPKIVGSRPAHLTSQPKQQNTQPSYPKAVSPVNVAAPQAKNIETVSTQNTPQNPKIAVDAQNLIHLCNNIISETKKKESFINSRYQAQISALNSEINVKNVEIKSLHQQVEDLQLLTEILEKNS